MSIWILAILIIIATALAGWKQGAIRAGIAFIGIIIAALLAGLLGRIIHPLLPHLGFTSPITAWVLAPVFGFILARIPFMVAAQMVYNRVDNFYKYRAGDLQLALFTRLNTRLGICIGVLNGAVYFILISFFIFNMSYWTTQLAKDPADTSEQPLTMRMVSSMGNGLQSSGFARTASAVGTLPPIFYQMADFSGFLMQNPQVGPRFAEYPGLISLWHRADMQSLVTDPLVTNALATGTSLGEILKVDSVKSFIANKQLTQTVITAVTNNLDDLMKYLLTGQSPKYGGEPILGSWDFNPNVTLAWLRQDQPKLPPTEIAAIRALWTPAYSPMTMLMTGDNQLYVRGAPKFVAKPVPNQPAFESVDGDGDWSRDGTNYTLHVSLNGDDKFLTATTDGLRLKVKDGRTILFFDHVN